MLFDQRDPLFRLSLWYIIPSAVLITGFFVFVVGKGVRSQLVPAKTGIQTMLGKEVNALTQIDSESGKVFFEGAYWNARSTAPINPGAPVRIVAIEGLTLRVVPKT